MKIKNILLWTTGIAGTAWIVDTLRIKEYWTLPVYAENFIVPIPQGQIDFKMDATKIRWSGKPGAFQIDFPVVDIIYKLPTPHTILTWQPKPIMLSPKIKSHLSLWRTWNALNRIKIEIIGTTLKINIPNNIRIPIYW